MGLFSKSKAGSSKMESAGLATLGGLQITLTILEKLMDSFPLPFVKGVAGAGVEVIKMTRVILTNRKDCDELTRRATSLLVVILGSLQGKNISEVPDDVKQRLERLTSTFHEVLAELQTVDKKAGKKSISGISRSVLHHYDNSETLKGCCTKLDWAMQEFQVMSQVDACLKDLHRHEELLKGQAELRQVQNDILEAVKGKAAENVLSSLPSTLMPANPRIFGREEYVRAAVKLLLEENSAQLAILGPGGMGKTSVALKVVHDTEVVSRFGSNIYWVPCEQATSLPLLVELLAKTLNLPTSSSNDRFGDVITSLRSSGEVHLFLLDNFETSWDIPQHQSDVADILTHLASVPTVSFVLTMRGTEYPASNAVDWSTLPSLTQLELSAARDAFLRIAPTMANDPQLDNLLAELDFMPLAIVLMAKVAGQRVTPSELLLRWRSKKTKLLRQADGDRRNCIEVSIKLSLESRAVKACPDAIELLSVISVLPVGAAITRLPDMCPSIEDREEAVDVLHNSALIYYSADRAFLQVLSPIRSYVLLHHPINTALLHDLQTAYCELSSKGCSGPSDDDFLDNVKELSIEGANIEAILHGMLNNKDISKEEALQASLDYSAYCFWTHHKTTVTGAALNVARTSGALLLPQFLQLIGDMLQSQNEYDEARSALNEARDQFTALGNQLGATQCLLSLGDILQMQHEYDEARTVLNQARDQFTALGNQLGATQCLQSLGDILRMQDEYDEARTVLNQARDQFTALGNQLGATQCLQYLGNILWMQDEYDEARTVLNQARNQFTALGNQLGATQCLQYLGNILLMQGEYDEARTVLNQAKDQFTALGDQLGATQCLQSLGDILRMQDEYDEARTVLNQARDQFTALGDQLGATQCLWSLLEIGDSSDA